MDIDDVHTDFIDLSDTGLLWLINRVVFHPRGYALALVCKDGTREVEGWTIKGDGSEVWYFSPEIEDKEFVKVNAFLNSLSDKSSAITQREHVEIIGRMMETNPPIGINDLRKLLGLPELPFNVPVVEPTEAELEAELEKLRAEILGRATKAVTYEEMEDSNATD